MSFFTEKSDSFSKDNIDFMAVWTFQKHMQNVILLYNQNTL